VVLFCYVLPILGADSALIASLSGNVTAQVPHGKQAPVSRLDWLPAGTVLQSNAKSSVTVLLSNGRRFELGPAASATIGPTGLSNITGSARELDPLPPIPKPAPLAMATDTVAVTRFRGGGKIAELCPRQGMAALAGSAKLSFQKVDGAVAYQIVLEDENGDQIVEQQSVSTEIAVPLLKPASHYSWRVRALGAAGVIAEDQAGFLTLSDEQTQTRQAFASGVRKAMEPAAALALLAEVDFESGLVREAIDGLQAALRLAPQDAAIKRDLDRVQAALAGK
jgi:hypothetical protein